MPDDPPGLYRLALMAPGILAATSYRAGVSALGVWSRKAPKLANLWLDAIEPGSRQLQSAGEFRKALLKTNEDATKRVTHEVTRGASDLDALTKPPQTKPVTKPSPSKRKPVTKPGPTESAP